MFHQYSEIDHKTIKDLESSLVGRGTILGEKEVSDYERFIPKKEFIKKDNQFSSQGVEWLYFPFGNEPDIHQCAQAFRTMAQYYILLGYSGIIYGSMVSEVGRNILLFDKEIAKPCGTFERYKIS